MPVVVVAAKSVTSISRERSFTGTVKAARESALSFERPGRIVSIMVNEGDRVGAGQALATIDVENVKSQLVGAKAQLEQAVAVLKELQSGPRAETIAAKRAAVAARVANVSRLQLNFARTERLVQSDAASREQFDVDRFNLAAAVAQRDASQRELDELLAGTRKEQLAAQKATVRQLEASVQSLQLDVEDGQLLSPYSGRVVERLVDEGTVVNVGITVLRLVDDATPEVWVGIPASISDQFHVGEQYRISIGGEVYAATLVSLRAQLDPVTRTRNVVFRLDSDAHKPRTVPGQIARLSATEEIQATGLLVPSSSLVPGVRGLWNVYVAVRSPDSAAHFVEQRNVELLYELGDQTLVRGTLAEGEPVIADGVHRVVAGQAVLPTAKQSEATR